MRGRNLIVVLIHFHITIKDNVAAITAINPTISKYPIQYRYLIGKCGTKYQYPSDNSYDICLFCFLDKPLPVVFVVGLPY